MLRWGRVSSMSWSSEWSLTTSFLLLSSVCIFPYRGTRWCNWLKHRTTSRKVEVSIGSLGFLIAVILPAPLWPWRRLTFLQKWVPGVSPGGKCGRCLRLTTLPPSFADCLEILRVSTSSSPKGLSRPVMGYLYISLSTVCGRLDCPCILLSTTA